MSYDRITREDDPLRCQAINATGQCRLKVMAIGEGNYTDYCIVHGGQSQKNAFDRKQARNYRIDQLRSRIDEKLDADQLKSLREEICLLRLLVEERFNRCTDHTDLILQSGPISDLIMKVERVVSTCHKLEGAMGQLMDKQALLQFANQVISIISNHLPEDKLSAVADEIIACI